MRPEVDQGQPADRPDRHEEEQGKRDAAEQPGRVVAQAGVDPENPRRVAIEDEEREDGEHDPDRTEPDERDGAESDERTHASQSDGVGDREEARQRWPEPQRARSGKEDERFANSHRSRSAAGCTEHGPVDRALHTPLRGLENRVWRCDPFQRMRVSP